MKQCNVVLQPALSRYCKIKRRNLRNSVNKFRLSKVNNLDLSNYLCLSNYLDIDVVSFMFLMNYRLMSF